jgi:DNA-binding winged helix-turn-helix (wHTH) protein/tetratricopeptide (TPR) repeat protein
MEKNDNTVPCFRFGVFDVDPRAGELRKSGTRISLQGQPLQVLVALLERPGEVVTREDLRRRIWPEESFGDFDHAVHVAVGKIRAALADSADAPRYVETLPRRGYRFVFPVTSRTEATAVASVDGSIRPARKSSRVRAAFSTTATIVTVGLALSIWWFFSRKPRVLTENDTIVLADFANSTGDQVFDGTLRRGLSVQLEQSPFLKILSDQQTQQTLQMMGEKPDAKLTPGIARELCQRTASAAVLDGSIAQIGSQYLLTLKAVRCSNENFVASAEAQARDKDHVLDALGKVASEIRKKLGESLTTVQKFDTPLEQATTSSLDALKAYSLADKSAGEGKTLEAIPQYQRALELDPNFASAHASLAAAYADIGESQLAYEHETKAFALRDRVSQLERLSIVSNYDWAVRGNLDKGIEAAQELKQTYPREAGPLNDLAFYYAHLGQFQKAIENGNEAIRLDPHIPAYYAVGRSYLALKRVDEARTILEAGLASNPDNPVISSGLFVVGIAQADQTLMQHLLDESDRKQDANLAFVAASYATQRGKLREARNSLSRYLNMIPAGTLQEIRAMTIACQAKQEAIVGNLTLAAEKAATSEKIALTRSNAPCLLLALGLMRDSWQAHKVIGQLEHRYPEDTELQQLYIPITKALLGTNEGLAKSIQILESTARFAGTDCFFLPNYVRGLVYLRAYKGREAAVEFRNILDHREVEPAVEEYGLAYLGLARAYSQQADNEKARTAYQDFLALWKDADPDIPILKQAKAEYAKLQ